MNVDPDSGPAGAGGPAVQPKLRILIVAESASARFGGEAALPLHYFRVLRDLGRPVWLVTHARNRDELSGLYPGDPAIRYVDDTLLNRAMWQIGRRLPARLSHFTCGFASRLATQIAQRRLARQIIATERIDVVHQPMPVSPREPSLLYGLGVPLVIGPMNGGMNFPAAFRRRGNRLEGVLVALGRASARIMNALMPGKREAALLLVANARTRQALPEGVSTHVVELVDNGVDLALWRTPDAPAATSLPPGPTRFIYLGRLIGLKAVDILLEAFHRAAAQAPMHLTIVGDGDQRRRLEALADSLGLRSAAGAAAHAVTFTGWLTQHECATRLRDSDCLVLPSLHECGGAVVLEAMATGKPVIATEWGGPADYVDPTCGILVAPTGRDEFGAGLTRALSRMASLPDERARMGAAGRAKVEREYDWNVKVARMLELYEMARRRP